MLKFSEKQRRKHVMLLNYHYLKAGTEMMWVPREKRKES